MDTEKLTEYADYLLQCAMYKVNNLSDAKDLVQETFLAALNAVEKGEREQNPFRRRCSLASKKTDGCLGRRTGRRRRSCSK